MKHIKDLNHFEVLDITGSYLVYKYHNVQDSTFIYHTSDFVRYVKIDRTDYCID